MEIAAKNKIITQNNKHFRPEENITQAEAIAMMLSAVNLLSEKVTDTSLTWEEAIMAQSHKLTILPEGMDDGSEKITRGELFYIVSNIIKVLYQQEVTYIDSLKTEGITSTTVE